MHAEYSSENLKRRDHSKFLDVNGNGNEPSGSIKGGEFLDLLSDYLLHKMDSVPSS
jgi:hypothetical protein